MSAMEKKVNVSAESPYFRYPRITTVAAYQCRICIIVLIIKKEAQKRSSQARKAYDTTIRRQNRQLIDEKAKRKVWKPVVYCIHNAH